MSFDEENFDEFVTFSQIRQNFPPSEIYAVRYSLLFDCRKPQMLGFLCVQFVSGLSIVLLMNDVTVLTNCIITIIVLLM